MTKNDTIINDLSNIPKLASRLDLAIEANSLLRGTANVEIEGVSEEVIEDSDITTHIITILNDQGVKQLNRPIGRYITLDIPQIESDEIIHQAAHVLSKQLLTLLNNYLTDSQPILIVGLGNNNAIVDALGPRVIDKSFATRHIMDDYVPNNELTSVCTIAPGVLGNSGIETSEIIRGVSERIKPSVVIVIDSLAAASVSRVGTTIQISETGIKPGSGIGNKRKGIDSDLTGCPVIAIGVPTIVDTAAIISETLNILNQHWQEQNLPPVPQLDMDACNFAEEQLLSRFHGQLMVTPKDIDDLIAHNAEIISAAIAIAIHPAASKDNYHDFIR